MSENKTVNILLPFRLRIPDKFEIRFEDKDDMCSIYYEEEFTNKDVKKEEIDRTVRLCVKC